MNAILSFLRVLSARPALRRAFLIVVAVLALWGAVSAFISSERADAADDLRRDLDAQKIQEVKDAIKRSVPGPRPGRFEFLGCLRRAGPGCL